MASDQPAPPTAISDPGPELRQHGYRLVVLSGSMRGHEIDITSEVVRIGKSRQCEVTLPDESVSRTHAELRREGDSYRLLDRASTNGTFVSGSRIADAWLRPGDVIGLGKIELRFVPREERTKVLPSERTRFGPVIGPSIEMRRVFGVLERVADKDVTVLLTGETGTGKDLLARAIHEASPRRDHPFVIVDCGGVDGEALEVDLFGRPEGMGRRGAVELAAGGTLFLDEVADLPMELQPKLMRMLDSGRFRRTGGVEEVVADVRVIAASHRNLADLVEAGELREDLYFRLSVVSCEIPPLRERREDIPTLIEVFSRRLPPGMWSAPSPEAMARLMGYDWPGNVRELRNVVERSAYLNQDGGIDLVTTRELEAEEPKVAFDPTLTFREQKERAVERFEAAYLRWLLERAKGNISRAAREADMDRKYLHKLLRRYGIDAKHYAK
ncbi:sigma-54 dependent transcriptional regulator, Fis family protein [Plesiocystis pacifica SIR-1]|uniref:Sigma-54 dependent transcriptional regulator, Fis family protein n=1 Tax=Plesiocystis pacifica SIR-1 TaxID=391625 RepID=A6GKI0_9BACT|nr:sigma 54-interacting transcriptional regulator [Plesiocystis pacifica]EDM73619.1 sigma-54 dependent transcriptional regulator, Fis family protein [Plesiocystis pacifica SIR-1]